MKHGPVAEGHDRRVGGRERSARSLPDTVPEAGNPQVKLLEIDFEVK